MNKLLGEKLSIITPKPQTTRQQIKGILTDEDKQIVFLDTPGFLKARYELHNKMLQYLRNSLKDSDVIIFITDAHKYPTDYDQELCKLIKKITVPKIAILNKIDLVDDKTKGNKLKQLETQNFDQIFPFSILKETDFNELMDSITKYLPFSPPFYNADEISDLPMRFFAQEIIRETIFLNFKDEIPYASTVVIEQYKEYSNKIEISANISLERKSQKPILLGKKAEKTKAIRLASEKEIHKIVGKRVKLDL